MPINTIPLMDITNATLWPEPTNAATNYRNQSTAQHNTPINAANVEFTKFSSVTDSSSGADNVKMTPVTEFGAANTVQSIVEAIPGYITNTSLSIANATNAYLSITNAASTYATITNTFTKAEVNSIATNFTIGAVPANSVTNGMLGADIKVGSLATLTTTDKTSVTNAVNEHLAESANKHITEKGSNANGNYIKFDDGTMICYLSTAATLAVTTAWASMFKCTTTPQWDFPATFYAVPTVSINVYWDVTVYYFSLINVVGVTAVTYLPVADASVSSREHSVRLSAIGRWKA